MTAVARAAVRRADGAYAPPPVYHWVVPPHGTTGEAAVPATGGHGVVALPASGSVPAGVATSDGQLAISLGAGAVGTIPDQRGVSVRITPLRTSGLPALPDSLRFNGNAYRISATTVPGGRPVDAFARPGSLTLELPELGRALYRAEGSGWVVVPSTPVPPRELAVSAELTRPGVYVSGTDLPPPVPDTAAPSSGDDGVPTGAIVAIVALVLLVGLVIAMATRMHSRRKVSASAGSPGPDPVSPDRPSGS